MVEKLSISTILDLSNYPLVKDKICLIPYLFAKEKGVLPLEEKDDEVFVASHNPVALDVIAELKLLLQKEIRVCYTPKSIIKQAIERCYHREDDQVKDLFKSSDESEEKSSALLGVEGYDLLENTTDNPVIRILNVLLSEAILQQASDIHFEPMENSLLVRFRIDGLLQKKRSPPPSYQNQILTRIKVMASMDIAETRLPQDGRIKLMYGGREIDFRVSTIPISNGERIVLRILDRANVVLGLDKIGMSKALLQDFRKTVHMPEGIVLVTGPTGSGKTTTLYSAISELNASEMNIMTIEDPVEYKLLNIAQMGVNPKIDLHFSTGLRHILRQDPDVIMIGEIRDKETAQIAIQASLTGHLVLSTLHTNDAPSALTRLADMGIEPYLLTSSVIGVLAQRLVRTLCPKCRYSYIPTQEELAELQIERSSLKQDRLFKGKGCDHCFHTGYKGRIGIYEFMNITPSIKAQVIKSVDAEVLRALFHRENKMDLRKSGALLAIDGITTLSELLRTTKISYQE